MPSPILTRLLSTIARANREGRRIMVFQLCDADMIALRESKDPQVKIVDGGVEVDGVFCTLAVPGGETRVIVDRVREGVDPFKPGVG